MITRLFIQYTLQQEPYLTNQQQVT